MNCAKTAEPIEMLYGMWTCGSPGNHVLGGGPDPFICLGSFGVVLGHALTLLQSIFLPLFARSGSVLGLLVCCGNLLLLLLLLYYTVMT